ncbi:hypothetical protein F3Y22_tig00110847pilonHSYRG00134 [Hibiscus syriacus]|uniref:Uncharacterized protein n=1 Tax=Hibiscus syriacus TaxID=106335 RepID=A0A6A2ZMY8_HIBSY|nr:hypothetical protein F3Y22_tig00110847pilonHSYRG00134 [Hibiscus syriacus]
MNVHLGGKFVQDPYVRYEGGELIRLRDDSYTISYFESEGAFDDTSTIVILKYWVKYEFIDIYVEHEVDTPDIVDDILLINIGEGNDKGDCTTEMVTEGEGGVEGVDATASEADDMSEGVVDFDAKCVVEVVGESVDDDNVVARKDVAAASEHEESDNEEDNAYCINVPYLSDGQDDHGLQSAREKMKGKEQVEVNTDSENETATETEIHEEAVDEGENIGVTECVGGVDTDYYDSDDHRSLNGSDDDGIEIFVNDILRQVEHRNYAKHVLANWTGRKRTKAYQFSFWKIVKSTTEIEWKKNKDALSKIDGTVATELFSKKEKIWTKAFQKLHAKSDIVDNNL